MSGSVLVLSAAPAVPDEAGAAASARLAETGVAAGPARRLAGSALELDVAGPVPALPVLDGVDVNLVPAEGRRKRLLLADMDSTIIGVECIDELAAYAGVGAEVAAVTERAMRGELDFEAALLARLALLKGLPEAMLERAYAERVRLNPGAAVLARTMRAHGAATALVSGGFTFFTERVAAVAGFAEHRANRLLAEGGALTGDVARPILGRAAKREALAELCARHGLGEGEAVAVGDGANDLDMVRAAGLGVAWRAKPALAAEADARLEHSDLTAILALQGIPERSWVQ